MQSHWLDHNVTQQTAERKETAKMNTTQVIPFQVRDLWLGAFALCRGVELLGTHKDNKGFTYFDFEPNAMHRCVQELSSGNAVVNIKEYHAQYFYLKGMLSKR